MKPPRKTAEIILNQISEGKTNEEILAYLTDVLYTEQVRPYYPYAAFRMNTEIMMNLIRKELQ